MVAHGLRGTLAGFLEVRLSTLSGGGVKHLLKSQNILYGERGLILPQAINANHLGGSGGILPWDILKLRYSEIVGNVYFFYLFLRLQSLQGGRP